jgi:hypothetical protein
MLGILEQRRSHGLEHAPATRTRRRSRMRVNLQRVFGRTAGPEATVPAGSPRNHARQRRAPLGRTLAEAQPLLRTLPHPLRPPQGATVFGRGATGAAGGARRQVQAHARRACRPWFGPSKRASPRRVPGPCTRRPPSSWHPLSALLPAAVAPELR